MKRETTNNIKNKCTDAHGQQEQQKQQQERERERESIGLSDYLFLPNINMPGTTGGREKRLELEGQAFCDTKSFYPLLAKHFQPSLEEIQSTTFSDYIRYSVLRKSQEGYDDEEEEEVSERTSSCSRQSNYCAGKPKIGYDYGK